MPQEATSDDGVDKCVHFSVEDGSARDAIFPNLFPGLVPKDIEIVL